MVLILAIGAQSPELFAYFQSGCQRAFELSPEKYLDLKHYMT